MSSIAEVAATKYHRLLLHYFSSRLANKSNVADLVQETYIALMRCKDNVLDEKAFIHAVARAVFYDHFYGRTAGRMKRKHVDVPLDELEDFQLPAMQDSFASLNAQHQLDAFLSQLPPTHRKVIVLHKGEGMSYDEVALTLKLSRHTVEKYVTQAKQKCRAVGIDI